MDGPETARAEALDGSPTWQACAPDRQGADACDGRAPGGRDGDLSDLAHSEGRVAGLRATLSMPRSHWRSARRQLRVPEVISIGLRRERPLMSLQAGRLAMAISAVVQRSVRQSRGLRAGPRSYRSRPRC